MLALCLLATANAPAAVRYVDVNNTNSTPPFLTWETAATNIQDAVDAALAGDEILVTNGVYQSGSRNLSRVAAPTDPSSALRLLAPASGVSGLTVTWQSVANRTYFLERATNLGPAPAFSLLASNLIGQAGTTSYTDTNATGPAPFFYRVGVQP